MQIAFCVHPHLATANEQRALAEQWLAAQGVESVAVNTDHLLIDSCEFTKLTEQTRDISLVCALGGDGTILRATRLAYAAQVPLLGINFGNLGFLSGASAKALFPALEAFLAGELHEDCRVVLKAEALFSDGSTATHTALNEVLLGRSLLGKVIVVDISVNGYPLPSPRGDGVIVATATGSTAYAHSAGGPLLTPDNQGLCIVPVSGLGFSAAALVSAPSDIIRLSVQEHTDQHPLLFIDGQPLNSDESDTFISSVAITKAERDMVFLRYDTPDFYTRIARSLAGGSHAR
ncbi:MAG: NAD(+)/NADH kinase [Coriobacteriales bacterium]|jgi:NAD+ kinase|nr:NAD(+)/NADH kinase [Coriobacteriales bacterium]